MRRGEIWHVAPRRDSRLFPVLLVSTDGMAGGTDRSVVVLSDRAPVGAAVAYTVRMSNGWALVYSIQSVPASAFVGEPLTTLPADVMRAVDLTLIEWLDLADVLR
ncbi:hypothetical protein Lfu02_30440 [Longispora fulva]|uniref:mRNA-degrading endonuclease toxin of MazEF toxin-antitoxin module n=1 Tax=Longispora fulva TaxID=619741 RepID=A0A8J7GK94_9ACTN|nr:type II toxin-antitoxin system PemK/MazF family toxin [Longispora fulva]MBG6139180.1 mRNA-degrading endonuclease toxin of MazEF toxin-antitoxin module [Longispora fulva]GIG58672.1 hypothetical protein Lfu02_30440 [Longispora fulva]